MCSALQRPIFKYSDRRITKETSHVSSVKGIEMDPQNVRHTTLVQ